MRIGIDARFYGPIGKGLGRYTQEVIDNIIKITSAREGVAFDYIVFLSPHNYDEFISEQPNIRKVLLNVRWYSFWEQLLVPFYIWREKLDLMHFPHFNVPLLTPVKFIVTIHDLILTHFPTQRATTLSPWLYYFKNLAYRLVIFSAVQRARRVIAVSEFTKQDIIKKFRVAPAKITVTYEGVSNLSHGRDSLFVAKLDTQETLDQYHIAKNFLLYVGNAYPHKNLEGLLRVFDKLLKEFSSLRLVLVGRQDYFYTRVQDYARSLNLWQRGNLNSPVIFPDYVPDAQLEVLYQEARAYIFPSLYEGFGLPPLEALSQGCPVVSSNAASLPEILGSAALYFEACSETDMYKQIKRILTDDQLVAELKQHSQEVVKKYNWWECARETLMVYEEVLRK